MIYTVTNNFIGRGELKRGVGVTILAHKILIEDFKTFKQRFEGFNRR